jgi:hypothetical protein
MSDVFDAEVIEDEPVTPRVQLLNELRQVLDLLEANPDLPLPRGVGESKWSSLSWMPSGPVEAAKIVRALGGRWEKNDPNKSEYDATYLRMQAKLGLELNAEVVVSREGVCEKKVVGTERRKVERVVQPEVTEEVYADVDVIEFECKSIMSLADQKVMAELEAIAS